MQVIIGYKNDQFFGTIVQALHGNWPKDAKVRVRLEKLVPVFRIENKRLLYNEKLWVPRQSLFAILDIAYDSRVAGHFKFTNTMSRLSNYHWRHMARDVKRYVYGCLKCRQ